MLPLIRTQHDNLQNQLSIESGLDCTGSKDMTRQEDRDGTDTNKILARYGIEGLRQRPIVYGELDTDLELGTALQALENATDAWRKMPQPIKDQFPSPSGLMAALADGRLQAALDTIKPKDDTALPKTEVVQ